MRRFLSHSSVSRREFLRIAGASALTVAATTLPVSKAPTVRRASAASTYSEAPMLAELVHQGTLPPVDERLPTTPLVIPTIEQIGSYGGILRRGLKGVSDRWGPTKMQDKGLLWFDASLTLRPHIVESWETNNDATIWTFHLRQGMKWSDGAVFDAESIRYWYDRELLNSELTGSPSTDWRSADGTVMTLTVVNAQTVRCQFTQPNPLFAFKLTRPFNAVYAPGHYLKQFHKELTTDWVALQAEYAAAGFNNWVDYYYNRSDWSGNPAKPSLGPWVAVTPISQDPFVMQRNPYYYAVDSANQQLPYTDRVEHKHFNETSELTQWVFDGEIDFQARHIPGDLPLLQSNEAAGGYRTVLGVSASHIGIQLNLTSKDQRLRTFFQQRDVRIALSLAVDRALLNTSFFRGTGTPRQYSPLSKSPQFYATLSNAYISFDKAQAEQLLDQAGYVRGSANGPRVFPGSSDAITFTIEGTADVGSAEEQAVQKVIEFYAEVGITASYVALDRDIYNQHCNDNDIDAAWWGGDRTVLPLADAGIFLGTTWDRPWALAWGKWRQNGGSDPVGEEPPAGHWIRDIWSKWDQIAVQADAAERDRLFQELLNIWAVELPMIGFLGELPAPVVVKNNLRNYLAGYPIDNTTADEHLLNPETLFWDWPYKVYLPATQK